MNKKKSLMRHAKKRWFERTGEPLTAESHSQIVAMIQRGESKVYDKQSHRVTVHLVNLSGKEWRVVYDKTRKQIITILPKEIV